MGAAAAPEQLAAFADLAASVRAQGQPSQPQLPVRALALREAKLVVLVGQLVSQTRNHLQEEEHELLPRIAETVPASRLLELGGAVRRTEDAAAPDRSDTGSAR